MSYYGKMDFTWIFYLAIVGLLAVGAGIGAGLWWLWNHVSLVVQ